MPGNRQQELVDAHFHSRADRWKKVYAEPTVEGAIYRKRLAIILEWVDELGLPAGEPVLEIGCGAGASTVALAKRGYLVHAIDSVPDMLNHTQQAASDAEVSSSVFTTLADAHDLAFPSGEFGLVLAIGVIPYLHSPTKALEEMARVLRPDGYLVVTQGNRRRLNSLINPWLWPALQPAKRAIGNVLRPFRKPRPQPNWAPIQFGSLRELESWLSAVGLVKVKAKTIGFPHLSFRSRQLFGEQTAMRLNRRLQWLADQNVPGIRSAGMDYVVLARKATT